MLSYRHGFHAGNHADVLKHLTLIALLRYLTSKDKPFCYLDSHAGKGLYSFNDEYSQKTGEYREGVMALWPMLSAKSLSDPLLSAYRDVLERFNTAGELTIYPGSPAIAQHYCRDQDKLVLMELHNNEVDLLQRNFHRQPQVHIHHRDGFEALNALTPPTPRRGMVLIDPSYELKPDYRTVVDSLKSINKKWPVGIVALWYPLLAKQRDQSQWFKKAVAASGVKDLLSIELSVGPQAEEEGMYGSGMMIINAPWQLDQQLSQCLNIVGPLLSRSELSRSDNESVSIHWLVPKP